MKTRSPHQILGAAGAARVVITLVLIVAVLGLGVIGMVILQKTGPEADKEVPPKVVPSVKVITAEVLDKQLYVHTQGEVKARMSTQLSSQVMGRVTKISPKLKAGGTFNHNEIMLEIERADYVAALARVESSYADAKLALHQEEARAEQAMRDWRKLGQGDAPDLVARKPQIVSAKARVTAAEAEVVRATRDLERTTVRAPYPCRVDQAYIDYGAHIGMGMRLADVHSIDVREIRVPVPLSELAYIQGKNLIGSHVAVEAEMAGGVKTWTGKIIRNEGRVDRSTMMMHFVVEVAVTEKQKVADLPPPGLFVNAAITGRVMKDVVEIPRSALLSSGLVLAVEEGSILGTRSVELARTMKESVLISSGISEGDKVIVSTIETPVEGMKVQIEATPNPED